MTPEDIDPCLCTHVIYAFSEMDNNQLTPMEKHDLKDGSQPGRLTRRTTIMSSGIVLIRLLRAIQCVEEREQEFENAPRRWRLGMLLREGVFGNGCILCFFRIWE